MMRKLVFFYFLIVIFLASCGSDVPNKLPSANQKKNKEDITHETVDSIDELVLELPFDIDSVQIIYSGGTEKDRHIVFVDDANNIDYYTQLNHFSMPTKFETAMYRDSYSLIMEQELKIDTNLVQLQSFPDKWLSVYYYNSDFYLYSPAREELNHRIKITDTTFMVFNNHGVVAEKISSFEKNDENYYTFVALATTEAEEVYTKEINIYFIDDSYSIAIWEEFAPSGLRYKLMIPANKAMQLPVVVNFGEKSKPDEFVFDEINYFEIISEMLQ